MKDKKQYALDLISDLVSDFLYYDRKECEILKRGDIDKMVKKGTITIDEMVNEFKKHMEASLPKPN